MPVELEKPPRPSINAALGDLAFLLLVFMITLMNSAATNRVELPRFRNGEVFEGSKIEVLSLTRDGTLNFRSTDMSLDKFISLLDEVGGKPIQFYVDRRTPFSILAKTLQSIQNQGDHRIILMNKPPPKEEKG